MQNRIMQINLQQVALNNVRQYIYTSVTVNSQILPQMLSSYLFVSSFFASALFFRCFLCKTFLFFSFFVTGHINVSRVKVTDPDQILNVHEKLHNTLVYTHPNPKTDIIDKRHEQSEFTSKLIRSISTTDSIVLNNIFISTENKIENPNTQNISIQRPKHRQQQQQQQHRHQLYREQNLAN